MIATRSLLDLAAMRREQRAWAGRSVRERVAVVRDVRGLIAERGFELAKLVPGAPVAETLAAQVVPLACACRFLEREAPRLLATRRLGRAGRPIWLSGVSAEVAREPLGVVLVIGAANYPLFLPGVPIVQALVAGNGVLVKPGKGGGAGARALASLLAEAGVPRGLVRVLDEEPDAVREALEAGVDKVLLTGSAETGRSLLAELAPRLVPATVELSGCDAAFVREDAPLDLVARALAFGLRLNGGQTCVAPRRAFVARALVGSLAARLERVVREIEPRPLDEQAEETARELVLEALAGGARIVAGELATPFAPIVLADVPRDARLLAADVFAPVLALVPTSSDDEALALASRCPYALGASVFGRDERAARALAARVRAGTVTINDVIVPTADPRVPFAGRGDSGFGATRGPEGLLDLTTPRVTTITRGAGRHLDPQEPGDAALFATLLRASHARSPWRRARAALALASALVRRVLGLRAPHPRTPGAAT